MNDEIKDLRQTIMDMDELSQGTADQITCLCRVLLAHLETPGAMQNPNTIAGFLKAIWMLAEAMQNDINVLAESKGANYVDQAWYRRQQAAFGGV